MYPGQFAEHDPDRIAVVMTESGLTRSYGELHDFATRFANLCRNAGLDVGDHVAFCLENTHDFLPVVWGCHYAGLYYTAISSRLTPPEIAYIVDDSGARAYLTSPHKADDVEELLADLPDRVEHLWSVSGVVEGFDEVAALVDMASDRFDRGWVEGLDMLYSSGTTGRPKGVKVGLPDAPVGTPDTLVGLLTLLFGATEDSVYLSPAPLYHSAPLRFCRTMHKIGGTVVAMEHFDPEAMLAAIERHRITFVQLVPTMFVRLLKLPAATRRRYDLSSLETVVHAAAPCPIEVKEQMIDWWGPIIHEYYAGTEGNGFCYTGSQDWLAHKGTVGRALQGVVHVVDDEGNEVPAGEVGTIYFESDSKFEYHNDPEKTLGSRLANGWSTLGDMGRVDEEGFVYLTDRKAFMIISGGVNLYPQEAENVLTVHPKVFDVAVFGVPNEDLGEEVKAVVQAADPADAGPELERELLAYCASQLARVKCPRSIDFRDELPRHPAGKLYKRLLRDEYWGDRESRIV